MENTEAEQLRGEVNAYLRPDETSSEDAKTLAETTRLVNLILKAPAESWTPTMRDFLAEEVRKGLANL